MFSFLYKFFEQNRTLMRVRTKRFYKNCQPVTIKVSVTHCKRNSKLKKLYYGRKNSENLNGLLLDSRIKCEVRNDYPKYYGGVFMKKAVIGVLIVIMVLSVGAISAFATESEYGRNFVDADKNGICDFAGDFCRYVDADHDGICDNRGTGQNGCANNFADADGDSIYDNYPGQGMGQKCGFRGGRNK